MSVDSSVSRINPLVTAILRSPFHWLLSFGLMLITVTGRRSGRRYTIPVGYQRHDDVLTILVSEAPKKQWWRNFRDATPATVLVKGKSLEGVAQLVPSTSSEFRVRVQETLDRLPWMAGPFGTTHAKGTALSDEQIVALGRSIAMVQVRL